MRYFEKISFEQFKKDVEDNKDLYDKIIIPERNTSYSAGYDIHLLRDITIKPGEIVKLPTGLKSYFEQDEVLFLIVRSSTGFKYNIRLVNQVGVIDADYHNNESNEGHIFVKLQNEGEKEVEFKKGDSLVQGIFMKYLTTKDDMPINKERKSNY